MTHACRAEFFLYYTMFNEDFLGGQLLNFPEDNGNL